MISNLTKMIAFTRRNHRYFQQFSRCGVSNKIISVKKEAVVNSVEIDEETSRSRHKVIYSLVVAAVLSTLSICLFNFREKFNKFISVAYALEKNDKGYRSRFNFVADVVEQCGNAVVCIESQVYRFGSPVVIPRGSGFIVREDGLVLTNAHVVMNKPQSLQVKLKDGRVFNGYVEDIDLETDLATIRIKGNNLPVMKLGTSYDLRAGEWVIAIGSPFALNNSVSAGVVSSPERKGEDLGLRTNDLYYIQTDVSITFGNSGGPLVNLDGEVVGVNTLKVVTGISFAIPIEFVKRFLKENEEERKKEGDPKLTGNGDKRGYMGVVMLTLSRSIFDELSRKHVRMPDFLIDKVMICEVAHNTPAYRSGLRPGDIISEVNGKNVDGVKSVYEALRGDSPLYLRVFRNDVFFHVTVTPDYI